ncbi:MAG: bifunctional diaminohydroxyphosphoribosylaminopyrimidine deaminase/5-amino-6-(5-phosphoribosylamino)uracil reductase RibD [Candidatus Omnitrophica bacterium]|nr:bifunctional diaminohydroxyphosphoribosylaminopyrimidine deaminase/5-amino-6-(5-phosphoribosylamino)uracil reductase RibD [Candidatus Omnitrophota bacterium]
MSKKAKTKHENFMRLALKLARRAKGKTSPNPLVGAVVVKAGQIVGKGYHKKAGLAHAEVEALRQAGKKASGARLYVTLEPCTHFGRTPPCIHEIKKYGIKEVIFAMYDPNPVNEGKAEKFLTAHGTKVVSGVLEQQARDVNRVFVKYITKKLPFVTVKIAQSLDGKIATSCGDSRWITSEHSRKLVHSLRRQVDAVLIGVGTALADDPLLTSRNSGRLYAKQPKKIIVDSNLRISPDLKMFSAHSPAEVIIATTRRASKKKVASFRKRNITVLVLKEKEKRVDLRDLLKQLARLEITHVLIEGGGEVIASALREKLVDKMIVFVAPKIIGGREAPTAVEGEGVKKVGRAIKLRDIKLRRLGPEVIIEGEPI